MDEGNLLRILETLFEQQKTNEGQVRALMAMVSALYVSHPAPAQLEAELNRTAEMCQAGIENDLARLDAYEHALATLRTLRP